MKNLTKIFFASATMVVMAACAPMTKESYLEKYDNFVTEVLENYKSYTDEDWRKMAEKHEQFSGQWYSKFEKELTLKDEIAIKTNQAKWYYYSNLNAATSTAKQLFESLDVKGIKEQVQYYIDNNMQSDLQKLYSDAQKAGKDTQEAVMEILEELNVQIDELQNDAESTKNAQHNVACALHRVFRAGNVFSNTFHAYEGYFQVWLQRS
jgi:hypothetical protein